MKERERTAMVFKQLRDELKMTCAVEVKVAHRGHAIAFSALEEHQERALKLAKHGRMYWKIEDGTYGQKPFDGFILCYSEALVAVLWPRVRSSENGPGKTECLTAMTVDDWCAEREAAVLRGEKSLLRERAEALSLLK